MVAHNWGRNMNGSKLVCTKLILEVFYWFPIRTFR